MVSNSGANGLMTSAPRGASPNGYWVLVTVPLPLAFDTRSASVGHDPFGCEKPGQLPRLLSSRKGQSTKSGSYPRRCHHRWIHEAYKAPSRSRLGVHLPSRHDAVLLLCQSLHLQLGHALSLPYGRCPPQTRGARNATHKPVQDRTIHRALTIRESTLTGSVPLSRGRAQIRKATTEGRTGPPPS